MAYIGNTVENQGFTPAIDYFNGNGVTVTFTLSRPIASVAQVIVAIDNVIQNPNSAFTVAGNAITFSSAPLSGTNNIWVEYTSLITTYQAISQDPTVIGDIRATGGYLAEGDFGNSFVDGAILDYVTGLGRITVGDADGLAIYNGGTASRTALVTVSATGNMGVGSTTPLGKIDASWGGRTSGQIPAILVGANSDSTTRSDTTQKMGVIGAAHYTNAQSPVGLISSNSYASNNDVYVGGGFAGSTASTSVSFWTAANSTTTQGTERMRIDANGYVTTPFQPAFKAFPSSGISLGSGVTNVTFNSTSYNVGSCYNTSTGLFTAPVAGIYIFETIFYLGNLATAYWGIRYLVNGTASQDAFSPGFGDTTVVIPFSVKLSANDTVRIASYFGGSATIGSGVVQSHFAGFLQG